MARFFIFLSYNGSLYSGWQIQENAVSIQGNIEKCLKHILNEDISLTGAGRTDSGVHAKFFVAHFDSLKLKPENFKVFLHKINSYLPNDIFVFDVKHTTDDANARFSAISRTYEYHISGSKNPFNYNFHYRIREATYNNLSINLMNEACKLLFNYSDFSCFSKSGTQTKTNNCIIYEAGFYYLDNELIFRIKANRFLRNMVRAITGTLLEVGQKKISLNDFCNVIESKNRSKAGTSVPAKGLFLTDISYPKDIYIP